MRFALVPRSITTSALKLLGLSARVGIDSHRPPREERRIVFTAEKNPGPSCG